MLLATLNLPKSLTFLRNFCKGVKIYRFSSKIIFGQIYRHLAIFSVHTGPVRRCTKVESKGDSSGQRCPISSTYSLFYKNGLPRPLFVYFRPFKQTFKFYNNQMWKMSIHYTVLGFKATTFEYESPPITTRLDLFLFTFVLFKHKFYRKNCRRQWDSNSDRRSRRWARWALDHCHHGPISIFSFTWLKRTWKLKGKNELIRHADHFLTYKSLMSSVANLIKHFTIIIYYSRVVLTRKLPILWL